MTGSLKNFLVLKDKQEPWEQWHESILGNLGIYIEWLQTLE